MKESEKMSDKNNNFCSTEKYAALLPCLFCGQKTNRLIHLEGCKERKYESIGFFVCDTCRKELTEFLNQIEGDCKE